MEDISPANPCAEALFPTVSVFRDRVLKNTVIDDCLGRKEEALIQQDQCPCERRRRSSWHSFLHAHMAEQGTERDTAT